MRRYAPLTKLILTIIISIWAILFDSPAILAGVAGLQLLLLAITRVSTTVYKGILGLVMFALMLAVMQYLFGATISLALVTGLRMLNMTLIFIIMLASTRISDITAALVKQCRIPSDYAFMFTAALRFIPDFLEESKAVREAQSCRGYSSRGNAFKRMKSYLTVVEPLVLRAVTKSETMAMSLELRGFGSQRQQASLAHVALHGRDYILISLTTLVTLALIINKLQPIGF